MSSNIVNAINGISELDKRKTYNLNRLIERSQTFDQYDESSQIKSVVFMSRQHSG